MAISPWTKPLDMKIAPLPFEALAYGYERRAKKEEEGTKAFDDLESEFSKIGAISKDRDLRDTKLREYREQLNNVIQSTGGDFAKAIPEINRIKRNFTQDVNYGVLGTVKSRYTAEQENLKSLDEARKKWIETGGEKGMNPEDYDLAVAALRNQEALEQSSDNSMRWTTKSGILYNAQNPRYSPDEASIALEYASKITPTEVTNIDPNLREVRPGHFYNIKTDKTYSFKEVRAELVKNMMMANPILTEYYGWKNNLTGKNDKAREIYSMAEQGLGVDEAGNPLQFNPQSEDYVKNLKKISNTLEQELYPGIYRTAQAVGALTEVNKSKSDIQFIKDFAENLGMQGGAGYNVYDRPISSPGFQVPTAADIEEVSNVHVTASGDVPLKSAGFAERTKGFLTNFLQGMSNAIGAQITGLYEYGFSMDPTTMAQKMSDPDVLQSMQEADKFTSRAINAISNSDNSRQAVTKVTDKFRENYPSLQLIPQQPVEDVEIQRPALSGAGYFAGAEKKSYTYDQNAGVVFNVVDQATKNMQAVSGKVVTLPKALHKNIEDKLVSTGVMAFQPYGTFSMPGAPYTEQVQQALGEFKDVKLTGVGDYLSEGNLVFSINGQPVDFKPSDQITQQAFPVAKASKKALISGKRQIIPYADGTSLIVQPDIIPGKNDDNSVRPDGQGSEFTVHVTRVDKDGKPVPFTIGNQSFNTILASDYYSLFELPNYITQFSGK